MNENIDEIIQQIKDEKDVFSKAKLIRFLMREKNIKVKEIATKLNINSSYVSHYNRIYKLPDLVVDGYYSKLISISHLFVISRIKDPKKIVEVYEKVLERNLNILQTEDLIREQLYEIKSYGIYLKDKVKKEIILNLIKRYPSIKMKIIQTKVKGKIIIEIPGNLEKTSKLIREFLSDRAR
ncbi:MAG: ParB-like protein partition protein [Candidatus Roizmanbacteria bacterium GW2011_GWA2_35_19]|uniref:ParB-like protein partition protein n=1 Tax=Candidatus Roizmanbacteria bacterium GW2011_GWA2_35_19 TaxID=1618478 RepID=A0A0G0BWW5_9BACT|nr:MAG: ParB-like protein partition protein [Candidatus Roizmanbacteria bacterium GW2011_GWA2_35_19]